MKGILLNIMLYAKEAKEFNIGRGREPSTLAAE